MKRDFDEILDGLRSTVADYRYYTDFDKVYKNVEKYKIELNILNSLIASKAIERDFLNIITEYPKTLNVIPLLLAKRGYEVEIIDEELIVFDFKNQTLSEDMYIKFMRESGLFKLLEESKISSLIDYVTGVEVGLDTNARKNRTGTTMENIVESFIKAVPDVEYYKEMKKSEISMKYNIDLQLLMAGDDNPKDAEKRFDFVVKTSNDLYLVETNFYSGGGSKLNETARSFKSLANDINNLENIYFVWITDGKGWISARNNLKETYDIMEHIYTIDDLESGVMLKLFK